MRIRVTMKQPDVLDDAITDAVSELSISALDEDEMRAVRNTRADKIRGLASRWFEYGEYLTVEIDTEAETCTVVPRSR